MDEKKRRSILRLIIVGVAALYCLVTYRVDEDKSATLLPSVNSNEIEHHGHMNRQLRAVSTLRIRAVIKKINTDKEDLSIPDWLMNAGQDRHPSLEQSMQAAMQQIRQEEEYEPAGLPKHNIVDAIQSSSIFRDAYAVMIYDNNANEFLLLYSSDERVS